LTLNFDGDRPSVALSTVGGSIKGQCLNLPSWGDWSGAVGLHERAKMKRSPHLLISAYCVTSPPTRTDYCKQTCPVYMPWGSVTVYATYRTARRRRPRAAL